VGIGYTLSWGDVIATYRYSITTRRRAARSPTSPSRGRCWV
jgi:hypothetical protein